MDEYILVIVMQGDLDLIYTSLTEGYADSVTYVTVGSLSGKKLVTDNNLFIMKGLASKEVVLRGRYVYDLYYTSKLWSDSNSVYFDTVVNSFKEL